jgi:quinolinate synthase
VNKLEIPRTVERNVELAEEIRRFKQQRDAVILAHNYQRGEVQDLADFVGDSLGLSQNAAGTDAEVIVFCGVYFMAETASILCPDKKFIVASAKAVCPNMKKITPEKVLWALQDLAPEVRVTEEIRLRARRAVDKMLEIGRVEGKTASLN